MRIRGCLLTLLAISFAPIASASAVVTQQGRILRQEDAVASAKTDEQPTKIVRHSARHRGLGGNANLMKYHTSSQIFSKIQKLSKTCSVGLKTEWVEDTERSGKLFVARVGSPAAKKKILVASNEHARELLTAEVSLAFIEAACSKAPASAVQASLLEQSTQSVHLSRVDKASLLQHVQYIIVPVVNVKGRALVETGSKPCQRMTTDAEGGVDLNRNMDVDWGKGDPQPWGRKPFSTYQARILRDLAAKEKPLAYIDLHTGARSLMTSWGYKPSTDPDFQDQSKLLTIIQKGYCTDCAIGSNRVVIGYTNPGEVIDHMYAKEKIKYSTLWELYQGDGDCVALFNPPDKDYAAVTLNWSNALTTFGDYIHSSVKPDERANPGSLTEEDALQGDGLTEEDVLQGDGVFLEEHGESFDHRNVSPVKRLTT